MQAAAGEIPGGYTGTETQTHMYVYSNPEPICGPGNTGKLELFKYSPLSSTILSLIFSSFPPPAVSSIPL